jgi:hypothetical protein
MERIKMYGPGRGILMGLSVCLRILDGKGRGIHAPQDRIEAGLVLDVVHQIGQGHELDPIQLLDNERVEVVPPLLAIADDIDACLVLIAKHLQNRLVGNFLELLEAQLPRLALPQRIQQVLGPGPATHHGDGEQG